MEFNLIAQPLAPLVEQAVEALSGYATQFQVTVDLHIDDATLCAKLDRDRMTQVITNLLSNAIKFSPSGASVELLVQRRGEQVRMSVVDHGCGIPNEFRERIFQKFAQANSTDSRQKGGTGLGLSICKKIVEEHGGTISYDSEEGNGAAFHVDVPAVVNDAEVEAQPENISEQ